MDYGKFLQDQRIKQNLSQNYLATLLGYTNQTISNFERNKVFPDLSIWGKYSEALGLSLEGFIYCDENKKHNPNSNQNFDGNVFANNIKYLRKRNNLTQIELADKLDVNIKTVISWEKAKSFPSLTSFLKLVEIFHLSIEDLYFAVSKAKTIENKEENVDKTQPKNKRVTFLLPFFIPTLIILVVAGISIPLLVKSNNNKINNNSETMISNEYEDFSYFNSEQNISNYNLDESIPYNIDNEPTIEKDSLEYSVNSDESITINKVIGNVDELIFPEKIDGYSVKQISTSAITNSESFKNKAISKICIPKGTIVEGFENLSFKSFTLLEEVNIPINVTTISESQFEDCKLLKSIYISSNVTTIESFAFSGCSNIKEIKIEGNISKIPGEAFRYCNKLESIILPDSITEIEDWAFQECESLKEINLPKNLLNIGNNVFFRCSSLTEVNIPSKVTSIGVECFEECLSLEEIYIPRSVVYIAKDAFKSCSKVIINIENDAIPDTWDKDWNDGNRPINYGISK